LPALMRARKLVVIAILTQIGCKPENFSTMTNRYDDLRVEKDARKAEQRMKADLTDNFTSLESKWQEGVRKSEKHKEHLIGTNNL
jgi:hypothetical protein